jgi:uncharacterized protein
MDLVYHCLFFVYFLLNCFFTKASNDREHSNSILYTFRLKPGEDLKRGISNFVQMNQLQAVSVVTCVGSLRAVNLRLASTLFPGNETYYFRPRQYYEIVSLVGTFEFYDRDSAPYGHMHMSVADEKGQVIGGHVMKGCIVFTTAEVTIVENKRIKFIRTMDPATRYEELEVLSREYLQLPEPANAREISEGGTSGAVTSAPTVEPTETETATALKQERHKSKSLFFQNIIHSIKHLWQALLNTVKIQSKDNKKES